MSSYDSYDTCIYIHKHLSEKKERCLQNVNNKEMTDLENHLLATNSVLIQGKN